MGILNVTGDMKKYSYFIDLKQISDNVKGLIFSYWTSALRYKSDQSQVTQECAWEKKFNSIASKMIA